MIPLKKCRLSKIGNGYYLRVPKPLVDQGVLTLKRDYGITIDTNPP